MKYCTFIIEVIIEVKMLSTYRIMYFSDAMSVIPEEMVRLSRTPRNFSYLLPFVEKVKVKKNQPKCQHCYNLIYLNCGKLIAIFVQMLEEKDYGIRYEQVLQYARESFGKLLRKLQLCVRLLPLVVDT